MTDSKAPVELFRTYRPTKFSEVVGQDNAINQLMDMGKRGQIPHFIMFVGPSGSGKTTLARILRLKLQCADADFVEINASEDRGIDMVRKIIDRIGLAPIAGKCKVYLIDECQSLTASAQESLLKPLEEPPPHVYFFLCTTDPGKMKDTTKSRGTKIICEPLTDTALVTLIRRVCAAEQIVLADEALRKLVEVVDGNARQALVILHAIRGLAAAEQVAAVSANYESASGFQLAQMLARNANWSDIGPLLNAINKAKEDPDDVRRVVLGYARTMLTGNGGEHAATMIREFGKSLWESRHAGLALASYNVVMRGRR